MFSTVIIEGQVVMERTNLHTFCWRSTNKGSFNTDMYGCIFHSFSVWYNFCNALSSETACRPYHTTWQTAVKHRLRNTDLYCTHNKGKNFKACISETKAHWMIGHTHTHVYFPSIFHWSHFCWNPWPKSDGLSLWDNLYHSWLINTAHGFQRTESIKIFNEQ
jgi:hypothetical protein